MLILDGPETTSDKGAAILLQASLQLRLQELILRLLLVRIFLILVLIEHIVDLFTYLGQCLFVDIHIFDDSLAKVEAHFLEHISVKMEIGIFTEITSTETGLECEGVGDSKLFPPNNTTCTLLLPLNREGAVGIAEDLGLLLEDIGEDPLFVFGISLHTVAVHEDVFLPRVAVQIAEKNHVSLLVHLAD